MTLILTRLDLSDAHNAHDCAEEFRKIRDIHSSKGGRVADWALKWGDALIENLRNPEVDTYDLERAENDATKAEEKAERLESAINDAIEQMDTAAEMATSKQSLDAYLEIASNLEKALAE